jgi:hypothetical protein
MYRTDCGEGEEHAQKPFEQTRPENVPEAVAQPFWSILF